MYVFSGIAIGLAMLFSLFVSRRLTECHKIRYGIYFVDKVCKTLTAQTKQLN